MWKSRDIVKWILIAVVGLLLLFVVSQQSAGGYQCLDAVVIGEEDGYVIVEPLDETLRAKVPRVWATTDVYSTNPVPDLAVGTEIRITYNHHFPKSEDERIDLVYGIYLLSEIH